MERWECPECGEISKKNISLCVCGYNENHADYAIKELETASSTEAGKGAGISVKKALFKIGKFILLVHLVAYAVLVGKQTVGRPHFVGKVLMLGALSITKLYIVPISKVFGAYSWPTKPFYVVRDGFYDLGWKALPDDDAERCMWWYSVRYTSEYFELVGEEILPYRKGQKHQLTPVHFDRWTNELFKHLGPLASLPLKDN